MSSDLPPREQLWIALSDLWLDTELSTARVEAIAAVVRASRHSRREVEDVLRRELAPILDANLRSPAGVWSGFDPEWVCAQARARAARPGRRGRLGAVRDVWARVASSAFGDERARAAPAPT